MQACVEFLFQQGTERYSKIETLKKGIKPGTTQKRSKVP